MEVRSMEMCAVANQNVLGCRLVRDGCKSIWCPRCGLARGMKLRARLRDRYTIRNVRSVGFATLTCSRAILGDDLQGQFKTIKDERLVSRFVRKFREVVGRDVAYFSVMEFHKESRQVHFHMALDGCGRLSLQALKELQGWCQEHMGTFDYKFMSSDEAIRYCLKYLTKGVEEGLPDWCLDYEGRLTAYSTSRGFWHDGKPRRESEPTGKRRKQRTLRVRIERCEDAGVVGVAEVMYDTGEVGYRYLFSASIPFETVREIACSVVTDREDRAQLRRSGGSLWLTLGEVAQVFRLAGVGRGDRRSRAAGTAAP